MSRILKLACVVLYATPLLSQQTLTPKQIFDKASASTVIILAGEGAGRIRGVATGVIISKDGVLLTALHAVRGPLRFRCV